VQISYNILEMETRNQETKTPPHLRNPIGKGDFKDNPQNINKDGRKLRNVQRFSYWLQFFKNMTIKELTTYAQNRLEEDMYVAENIALNRVINARKHLDEYKDLADRTEGKAPQTIKHEGEIQTGITDLVDLLQNI